MTAWCGTVKPQAAALQPEILSATGVALFSVWLAAADHLGEEATQVKHLEQWAFYDPSRKDFLFWKDQSPSAECVVGVS